MTIFYILLGFLYSIAGIFMVIFGNSQIKIMGFIYLAMPVIMAVVGFIFIALFAWVYNCIAKRFGGIEFEVTDIE